MKPEVYCDPDLPDDVEREVELQRAANAERFVRDQQEVEPLLVQMFRRMGLL